MRPIILFACLVGLCFFAADLLAGDCPGGKCPVTHRIIDKTIIRPYGEIHKRIESDRPRDIPKVYVAIGRSLRVLVTPYRIDVRQGSH